MPLARTGESDEPSTRRRGGRLLLVAGAVTALGAASVLVLTDDLRWLRLGVVAALWAALVGAFIAARYRGQVAEREDRAADLQAVYELELEREIAARREYELQVEAEIRAEVDEQSRRDVAALRDELRTLRQTLENLLGGEVLVERYALQAQATRMRPLQEAQRKRLPAAVNGPPPEPVTEQFDRVTELRPVKTGPRAVPPLPRRADRPERSPWPTPVRQPTGEHPDPRVAELPPTPVAQFRPPSAETRPPEPPQRPVDPPRAEPPTRGGFRPVTGEQPVPRAEPRSWEQFRSVRAEPPHAGPPSQEIQRIRSIAEQSLSRIERVRQAEPPPRPPDPPPPPPAPPRPPEPPPRAPEPTRTAWEERPVAPPPPDRQREDSRPGRHSGPIERPGTGGRRRRAEPDPESPRRHARPDAEPGGRRRRAEDTPSWQELAAWDPVVKATSRGWARDDGSHARADEGSHATGHSVADLLAQHGADAPRRRRRREE